MQMPAVSMAYAGILNRLEWAQEQLPFQPGHVLGIKTSPCFVDSVFETFAPLLLGEPESCLQSCSSVPIVSSPTHPSQLWSEASSGS